MWAERRIGVFMLQRWSRVGCDDRRGCRETEYFMCYLDPSPARDGARFEPKSSVWHHFLFLL